MCLTDLSAKIQALSQALSFRSFETGSLPVCIADYDHNLQCILFSSQSQPRATDSRGEVDTLCTDGPLERRGRRAPDNSRPRLLPVKFGTLQGKRLFFSTSGLIVDNDLTCKLGCSNKSNNLLQMTLQSSRLKGANPFSKDHSYTATTSSMQI